MKVIKELGPGIVLCLAIAMAAWFLGRSVPLVGAAVFGILLGIIVGLFRPSLRFRSGVRFTSKKLLQAAIILLGFEMNMLNVLRVGGQSLWVMFFTLSAAFLTAWVLGRVMGIAGNEKILVGVGTAICGGSAIAATAPVIRATDDEMAQSISTIFLFNVIAVFLFPALGHIFGLSDAGFGLWAGTAINDTSSVVAAGATWSETAGSNSALATATIVKLTRTLLIIPVTLVLALYMARKAKSALMAGKVAGDTGHFSFRRVFPWFVLGFVLSACLNTFLPIPVPVSSGLVTVGKFLIVMAMAAIGLNTDPKKLLTNGLRPILLGFGCWLMVASVSLLVQRLSGQW